MQWVDLVINPFLGVMAVAYAALAVRVSRSGPQYANSTVSFFLALIGGMLAGSAFSYNADSAGLYSIGRTLSYSAAAFLPLVFYMIYREYTVGPPRTLHIAILAVIPMLSVGIALTNSMHNILWIVNETSTGLVHSEMNSHPYYSRVYAPFTYGLFAYAALALVGRLPTIAPANRKTLSMMLVCALFPYSISIANTFLGMGPPDFM